MNKVMIYLLFFAAYSLILILVGKNGLKETNTIEDFFVGGKRVGVLMSVLTFSATWFSAASIQGFTGSIYFDGYEVILWSVVGWFAGAGLLYAIAVPLRKYEVITIPEFFRQRYDSKGLQVMGGGVIIIAYIMYIIIQITGFGIVMSKLLDISYSVSLFLIYLFIIYTTFGGFYSVAKTDALNIIITMIGVFITAFLVVSKLPNIFGINELVSNLPSRLGPSMTSINTPLITIVSTAFAWGHGLSANPQYLVRISSAKDDITAKKMIKYSILFLSVLYILLTLIGIGGRILVQDPSVIGSVDEVYSFLINYVIYSKYSGLIMIGMAAAAISTINSQLLLISSSFMMDVVKVTVKYDFEDEKVLFFSRIFIIFAATISLVLSFSPPESLLIYGSYVWAFFSITFFLPLYGGIFWKGATKLGAYASVISGTLVMGIIFLSKGAFNSSYYVHPVLPSFAVALVFFIAFSDWGGTKDA